MRRPTAGADRDVAAGSADHTAAPLSVAAAAAALSSSAIPAAAEAASAPPARKSLLIAYVLWMVGGWIGLHHAYLGRDDHALLYCTTFGGFGVAYLRDAFALPRYVAHANRLSEPGSEYCERLRLDRRLRGHKGPRMSALSLAAQIACGLWFGELCSQAFALIAPEVPSRFPSFASAPSLLAWVFSLASASTLARIGGVFSRALGVSVGVWGAGNARRVQHSPFLPVFLATVGTQLLSSMHNPLGSLEADSVFEAAIQRGDTSFLALFAAVASYLAAKGWSSDVGEVVSLDPAAEGKDKGASHEVRPRRRPAGTVRRSARFVAVLGCFVLLATNYFLHVRVNDEAVKVHLSRAWASPEASRLWDAAREQWALFRAVGAEQWWSQVKGKMNEGSVDAAFQSLGLDPSRAAEYTDSQLRRVRNKLALKYHPDKPGDGTMTPEEREAKFNEIQKAYERIGKWREERGVGGGQTSSASRTASTQRNSPRSTPPPDRNQKQRASPPPPQESAADQAAKAERLRQANEAGAAAGDRFKPEQRAKAKAKVEVPMDKEAMRQHIKDNIHVQGVKRKP